MRRARARTDGERAGNMTMTMTMVAQPPAPPASAKEYRARVRAKVSALIPRKERHAGDPALLVALNKAELGRLFTISFDVNLAAKHLEAAYRAQPATPPSEPRPKRTPKKLGYIATPRLIWANRVARMLADALPPEQRLDALRFGRKKRGLVCLAFTEHRTKQDIAGELQTRFLARQEGAP